MSTDAMWAAGETYYKVFGVLYDFPIILDIKPRKFVAVKKRRLIGWALSVIVLWGLSVGPQLAKLLFIIFKFRGEEDVQLESVLHLYSIFLFVICSGGAGLLGIVVFIFREDIARSINFFSAFEAMIKKRLEKKSKAKRATTQNYLAGIFSHILRFLPVGSQLVSTPLIIFAVFQDLDSGFFILEIIEFLGTKIEVLGEFLEMFGLRHDLRSIWTSILLVLIRFVFLFYVALETCRVFTGVGMVALMAVWVINHSLIFFYQDYTKSQRSSLPIKEKLWCIQMYHSIKIAFRIFSGVQTVVLFVMLYGVGVVIVFCNYVTVLMYEFLPLWIYFFAPISSICLCLIIHSGLPRIVLSSEISAQLLRSWNEDFGVVKSEKQYFGRMVKTLSPIRFNIGILNFNFAMICKTTKAVYYAGVTDWTITTLLSFR